MEKKNEQIKEKVKGNGQYFTISEHLQQYIFDNVRHKNCMLLEPSFGAGHLLQKFKNKNSNYPMMCYELDKTIIPIVKFTSKQHVIYGDFLKENVGKKFKTIIGNPPYVKYSTNFPEYEDTTGGQLLHKKSCNLYLKFIDKCTDLLTPDGELIFIVPSEFLKLTSSSTVIKKMCDHGSFTDFLFPHDETLFDKAHIDVVVFRYQKGIFKNTVVVNEENMYCNTHNNIILSDIISFK